MKDIKTLKKLKTNLMLLGTLSVLGTTFMTNNINVQAQENYKIESNEEDTTTRNDNSNPETFTEKVTYYSNVFGIREDCIYDIIDYMLNESNEDYSDLKSDELILTATRQLYYDSNYSSELKRTNKTYEVTLSPEEMVEKYSEIYGINKEVALSIVYCECGSNVDSYNYRVNNNPAGLGPSMYFENKEIGIIYFINLLKNSYGCTKDSGSEFLGRIASTYCEIPDHWLSLTLPFYNNLCEDYYYMKPELKKKKNVYLKAYGYTNEKESN